MWAHKKKTCLRGKVRVVTIEDKMQKNRLRQFEHMNRRPKEAPVKKCNCEIEAQGKRGIRRLRKLGKRVQKRH